MIIFVLYAAVGILLSGTACVFMMLRYLGIAQGNLIRDLAFYMMVGGTLISVLALLTVMFSVTRWDPYGRRWYPNPFGSRRFLAATPAVIAILIGLYFGLAALDVLARSARAPLATASRASNIEAAWVQIVPLDPNCTTTTCDAQALVRVILPEGAGSCDGAAFDAETNLPLPLRVRPNPRRAMFPILLCETALPLKHPGTRLADGTTLGWSHLQKTPHVAALLGDSGCNYKDGQDCIRTATWPLARIAMQAAWTDEGPPDLIVHVGDYRYRGKDDWSSWRDDFFAPARPLLATAPWIMARGNHENCYRNKSGDDGDGWTFLLEPTPGAVKPCDWSKGDGLRIEEPYALDLGAVRVVVLDTADAYYRCNSYYALFKDKQVPRIERIFHSAPREPAPGRALWLVSHYPVFNAAADPAASCDGPKDKGATVALQEIVAKMARTAPVQAVFSGDQHSFQVMPVAGTSLLQLVVGHGGTLLDSMTGTPTPGEPSRPAGIRCRASLGDPADETDVRARVTHGYVTAVLKGAEWRFTLRTVRPADQEWEIAYPSPSPLAVDPSLPLCHNVLRPPPTGTSP